MNKKLNIFMSIGVAAGLITAAIFAPTVSAQNFTNLGSANFHSDQTFTLTPHTAAQNQQAPENDCICIQIYAPVCGIDGKTYGNSCVAQCAGVPIAHEGECKAVQPTPKPAKHYHRLPVSIQTNVKTFQGQYVQTNHPVTIQQHGNLHIPGLTPVQASWSQHLHASGQLTQESRVHATTFWQRPVFFWHSFSW